MQHIRPPAAASRTRGRHRGIALSFLLAVVLPFAVATWYLYERAADQYASYLGFSVRTEESSSAIELLGGITELSGSSSSDTDILFDYLNSQQMVRKVDEKADLRGIWSRVSTRQDPVFAYDPNGSIEDLLDHWKRMVQITYDSGSGLLNLRILAFDPAEARKIASVILEESDTMINNLSAIAREDAIKYARDELETAVERLKEARRAMTSYRNRTQIVDPSIDTQNQMGLLTILQQQLAEALIEQDLLMDNAREGDPRVIQGRRRVVVIEQRIAAERRKLGLGGSAAGATVFANLVGEYEGLLVDREFSEQAYTVAWAAYDAAQAEARKQSRYLAAHIRPTLAERAEYPDRPILLLVIGVFLLFVWLLLVLIYYSLRDRR
ncbi:capsule biosynthesis protein [Parasedimentitalea marina]|uniref:capsule biosynthesis protein n=1 Tax=Parasedimentitalea marina TaxID=2483033 RepID=UPI001EE7FBD6|nr:capsule biosynthesis protein [Parasedimentitalea marina]